MAKPKPKYEAPPPMSAEEQKRFHEVIDKAVNEFGGIFDELEKALGMYILGRYLGWKPLLIIHSKGTIKKYEAILGIEIRTEFAAEGPHAKRSMAFDMAERIKSFWKVASGEQKVEDRRWIEKGTK
jgi:hypothetical protein